MPGDPIGIDVRCPSCDAQAIAIIPEDGELVDREEDSDGKVRVNCPECGTLFLAHFRYTS